jgi:hypothetical protein
MLAHVRKVVAHTTNVLMDTDTLMSHRSFWSTKRTSRTDLLPTLTAAEQALHPGVEEHRNENRR